MCRICLYASKIPRNAAIDAEAIIISSEYTILLSVPAKKIIEFAAVADTISPSNNRLGVMYVCATIVFAERSIRI
ncbi:MAG: hypothetical protein ICV56_04185 [Nitrososphaeraceae archaeon]|nr:hypothetical protein [Nitrososphaeraceae archaeon]